MDRDDKRLTDYLVNLGVQAVGHTQKTYLGHLMAVQRLLEGAGYGPDVCRAGLFHSIYGTELFQGFKLPLENRDELRALIGERAERLAYLNCAMDRPFFDKVVEEGAHPPRFRDRLTGEESRLSTEDFDDLCRVHLFDWLEQAPRSRYGWGYRRATYRAMAQRLGESAQAAYETAFAAESAVNSK
jgi:hypothetical protein